MKLGEYGWVQTHANGFYVNPVKVKILETGCSGIHSVKVITESGAVHYCKPDQIKSRPGKALKAEPAIPAEVKAKAEKIADQKIKEFKEKEKQEMEIITEKQAAERKDRAADSWNGALQAVRWSAEEYLGVDHHESL